MKPFKPVLQSEQRKHEANVFKDKPVFYGADASSTFHEEHQSYLLTLQKGGFW